ncbi:MAG: hypothetical protein Q8S73_31700 [Deltaproteobacteria bacterium]|nr:hypothetical protein [Myxococcales bacterium]MDP3218712.1 hypothetical protein [Deltaproteobacteria bacterium]
MPPRRRPDDDPTVWVREEERRAPQGWCTEEFDRVDFARRVLDVLKPRGVRVLLRDGAREFVIEQGRLWSAGDARWAMVAIPRQASREDIMWNLVEVVGYTPGPYRFDVMRVVGAALAADASPHDDD